jgi:hypothetical protein
MRAVETRVRRGEQQRCAAGPPGQRQAEQRERQQRVRALPEVLAVVVVTQARVAARQSRDVGLDRHAPHKPEHARAVHRVPRARAVHEGGGRSRLACAPAEVGVLAGGEAVGLVEPAQPLEERARVGDVARLVVPVEAGDLA